jgi:lysophospholipase L1-like esterase
MKVQTTYLAVVAALVANGCAGPPLVTDRTGDGVIRVVVLGDSNTKAGDPRIGAVWVDQVAARYPTWEFVNHGIAGARATGKGLARGMALLGPVHRSAADLVLITLGTNDIARGDQSPEDTVAALIEMREALLARNIDVMIATIPPVANLPAPLNERINARIDAANRLLAQALPAEWLIDFHAGVTPEELMDGIHLSVAGHRRRAAVMAAALVRHRP